MQVPGGEGTAAEFSKNSMILPTQLQNNGYLKETYMVGFCTMLFHQISTIVRHICVFFSARIGFVFCDHTVLPPL